MHERSGLFYAMSRREIKNSMDQGTFSTSVLWGHNIAEIYLWPDLIYITFQHFFEFKDGFQAR